MQTLSHIRLPLRITPLPKLRRKTNATLLLRLERVEHVFSRVGVESSTWNDEAAIMSLIDLRGYTGIEHRVSAVYWRLQNGRHHHDQSLRFVISDRGLEIARVLRHTNDVETLVSTGKLGCQQPVADFGCSVVAELVSWGMVKLFHNQASLDRICVDDHGAGPDDARGGRCFDLGQKVLRKEEGAQAIYSEVNIDVLGRTNTRSGGCNSSIIVDNAHALFFSLKRVNAGLNLSKIV